MLMGKMVISVGRRRADGWLQLELEADPEHLLREDRHPDTGIAGLDASLIG